MSNNKNCTFDLWSCTAPELAQQLQQRFAGGAQKAQQFLLDAASSLKSSSNDNKDSTEASAVQDILFYQAMTMRSMYKRIQQSIDRWRNKLKKEDQEDEEPSLPSDAVRPRINPINRSQKGESQKD